MNKRNGIIGHGLLGRGRFIRRFLLAWADD